MCYYFYAALIKLQQWQIREENVLGFTVTERQEPSREGTKRLVQKQGIKASHLKHKQEVVLVNKKFANLF